MAAILGASAGKSQTQPHGTGGGSGRDAITEGVREIMDREKRNGQADLFPDPVPRQLKGRLLHRGGQAQQNPFSPAFSQWPLAAQASATPSPALPQTVGPSFVGATFYDTIGYVPPDSMGAVGPSQVLVIVNGRIRVFDKSGNRGLLDTTTDNFFASVRSASTSDPHVRYDRLSQHWFISMLDVATPNRILLAVSSGPTITDSTSFSFFQFQHDLVGPTPNSDTGGFADYDTLGVDRSALYIGVNVFNATGTALLDTTGFVVNKANLLAGTLNVTALRQMGAAGGTGPGIITPQGVDNDDPNATEGYFIGTDNQFYGLLDIVRVSNPDTNPAIAVWYQMSVLPTTAPISQVQRGSTLRLDALDDRLFGAAMHKNKIAGTSTLWTAHSFEVNSSGVAQFRGGRNGSRWYEIGTLTTTPSLVQSGTLYDPATSSPRGFWIPGIVGSGQGHMAIGCSYAGLNDYPGVAVAGRLRTDALGATRSSSLAVVSSSSYALSPARWGDYSAVAVDPNDDMTMWAFEEYSSAGVWAVQAVPLSAPPPATPWTASPSSVGQGQAAVDVVITGNSSSGSEFFDPGADPGGPGFANHISASVSGGVVVNTITFNSPTQVTLNLNTTGAAAGTQNVTINNPDGQSSTGTGILTISSTSGISCSVTPSSAAICAGGSQTFTANPVGGTAPYSYLWSNGATTQSITVSSGGTYSVTVTDAAGLTSSCSATVTVNPFPTTSPISGSSSVCANQTGVTYSVALTSGSTYSWTVPPGATITSGAIGPNNNSITVNFGTSSGNVTVTETSAAGCVGAPQTESVNVGTCDFALSVTPPSQTVTAGSGTTYTVTVTPLGAFSGAVSFSVSGLPNRTSASFSPSSVNIPPTGSSTLTVSTSRHTPKGTYSNVTITALSGTLQHTATVTLVVQ